MKRAFCILAMILAAAACMIVDLQPETGTPPPQPDGRGILAFGLSLPEVPATKVMGAEPGADMELRLAAFGSTGYLKEYVKAEPIEGKYPHTDGKYYFTAPLSISDQTRNVHLIVNGPESLPFLNESEVLTGAYTTGNTDSYWQRIQVARGIRAKKDWDDASQQWVYRKKDGNYVLEDDVVAAFSDIVLIRNFAQITVESVAPNFELDEDRAFVLVNRPDRGSIAPYNVKTGAFMANYYNLTYQEVQEMYPGYMPVDVKVGENNPSLTDNSGFMPASGADYMYERTKPNPSVPASYLIVYGKYYPDSQDKENFTRCYYKINLMDKDGYYTIYRNFRYNIRITKVAQVGATTPSGANATGGTGNITWNTDISGDLTDISDGIGRIYLTYTAVTLPTQQYGVELKYKFIPDVTDNENGNVPDNNAVTITVNPPNSFGNVFADTYSGYDPSKQTLISGEGGSGVIAVNNDDDPAGEGWRSIFFDTVHAGTSIKTQKISLRGISGKGSIIDREVVVNLLDRQNLIVNCRTKHVKKDLKASVIVDVSIPKNLPESMFPLVFDMETADGTLTPDPEPKDAGGNRIENNLPVYSGPSMVDPSKVGFMFKRTLSYDEYLSLTRDEEPLVTFTSYFNPNKLESATTVYASNKEYFNIGSDFFYNYCNFSNMAFSVDKENPVYSFRFSTEPGHRPNGVYVRLDGLKPDTGCLLKPISGRPDEYYFDLTTQSTGTDNFTITNLRNVGSEEYTITLSTAGETNMYVSESVTAKRAVYQETGQSHEITINAGTGLDSMKKYEQGGIRVMFSDATFTDGGWFSDDYMDIGNGSELSVSSQIYDITEVTLNYQSSWGTIYHADISVSSGDSGNITKDSDNRSSTWTGSSGSQIFTITRGVSNRDIRITSITVTATLSGWYIPL